MFLTIDPPPPKILIDGVEVSSLFLELTDSVGVQATSEQAPVRINGNYPLLPPPLLEKLLRNELDLVTGASGVVVAQRGEATDRAEQLPCGCDYSASDPVGRLEIEARLMRCRTEDLIKNGVIVKSVSGIHIGRSVVVAPTVILWPGVVLLGDTRLEQGVEVHAGAWLKDTTVGENTIIKPYCVCESATIGSDCAVGPMAHLRPDAHLHEDVKVGNFVEVKKSILESGVRASHLSYLGDATIGAKANIGAGTITCNYDGYGKHRTVIGEEVFIGSNSSLVAPITIGSKAVIGAGSTLSADVPAGALAVERANARILPGKGQVLQNRNKKRATTKKERGDNN